MSVKIDGTWVGFYAYPYRFGGSTQVPFIANIVEFEEGNFEGVIEDDVTQGGLSALALIKGDFDGKKINFVKNYPSHAVYYQGSYDEVADKFEGKWRISPQWGGHWEMQRGGRKEQYEMQAEEVEMQNHLLPKATDGFYNKKIFV